VIVSKTNWHYLIGWGNRLGTVHTWACGIWFGHSGARRIINFDSANEELAEVPSGRPTPVLPLSATAAAAPSGTPAEGVAAP
jgi:NADH dehydrogenase